MTPPGQRHIDQRPLPEKLEEHVEPVVYTIDVSSGRAYKVRGTGQDFALLLEACRKLTRRIEEEGLDPQAKHFISIPKREVH